MKDSAENSISKKIKRSFQSFFLFYVEKFTKNMYHKHVFLYNFILLILYNKSFKFLKKNVIIN